MAGSESAIIRKTSESGGSDRPSGIYNRSDMKTAWLEKAFVELADKSSEEAQEILRHWVATRLLAMSDYHELADRLTAAYLERDTRRAASQKAAPTRSRTGRLPPAGEKKPKSKTGKLPVLPGPAAKDPGSGGGSPQDASPPSGMAGRSGAAGAPPVDASNPDRPAMAGGKGNAGPLSDSRLPGTRPLQQGHTRPFGDRFRSRPPGGR